MKNGSYVLDTIKKILLAISSKKKKEKMEEEIADGFKSKDS